MWLLGGADVVRCVAGVEFRCVVLEPEKYATHFNFLGSIKQNGPELFGAVLSCG
jgi:hypothetical protein